MTRRSEILSRLESQPAPALADHSATQSATHSATQSAREFLDAIAWDGETPDPDLLTAREFLAWL